MSREKECRHGDPTWNKRTWCKRIRKDGYEYLVCLECGILIPMGKRKWKVVEQKMTKPKNNQKTIDPDESIIQTRFDPDTDPPESRQNNESKQGTLRYRVSRGTGVKNGVWDTEKQCHLTYWEIVELLNTRPESPSTPKENNISNEIIDIFNDFDKALFDYFEFKSQSYKNDLIRQSGFLKNKIKSLFQREREKNKGLEKLNNDLDEKNHYLETENINSQETIKQLETQLAEMIEEAKKGWEAEANRRKQLAEAREKLTWKTLDSAPLNTTLLLLKWDGAIDERGIGSESERDMLSGNPDEKTSWIYTHWMHKPDPPGQDKEGEG